MLFRAVAMRTCVALSATLGSSLRSDVEPERKRSTRDWTGGDDFAHRIRELERHRLAVAVDAGVVVQLRQGEHVPEHRPDVSASAAHVNEQRLRDLATGIRPQPRDEAVRPQIRRSLVPNVCEPAKQRLASRSVNAQVRCLTNANTHKLSAMRNRAQEAAPLSVIESRLPVNEQFPRRG